MSYIWLSVLTEQGSIIGPNIWPEWSHNEKEIFYRWSPLRYLPPVPHMCCNQVNQQKHCRLPLVTSSEEWTVLGTNPLLTPSQPSWILMSPLRTRSKMVLVKSTNA